MSSCGPWQEAGVMDAYFQRLPSLRYSEDVICSILYHFVVEKPWLEHELIG